MEKKERSLSEVEQEFNQKVAQAGYIQYQIYALSLELDDYNDKMKHLNLEAAKIKEAAKNQLTDEAMAKMQ